MTAPTTTTMPHGYGRYTQGCRCDQCRGAKATYMRTKRAEAGQRSRAAKSEGQLYVADGIAHGITGYRDHSCRCAVCRRARKGADFRSIPPKLTTSIPLVEGFGAARRVQALYRWGWPFAAQAEKAGLSVDELIALTEPVLISGRIARLIERLYDQLAMAIPPSTSASEQARADGSARGWALPLEWDDDEIDNPGAIPATVPGGGPVALKAWLVNYQVLAARGLPRRQIAEAMNTTSKAIKEKLVRARSEGYLPAGIVLPRGPQSSLVTPCGTPSAFARHKRRGEAVDEACLAANRAYKAAEARARRQAVAA